MGSGSCLFFTVNIEFQVLGQEFIGQKTIKTRNGFKI